MRSRCITCFAKWLLPLSSFYFAHITYAQISANLNAIFFGLANPIFRNWSDSLCYFFLKKVML